MAAGPAPRKSDTSPASLLLPAALLLARQLRVVVVVVFEVARDAAAGTLTLTDPGSLRLVPLLRLTAIVLDKTHSRTQIFSLPAHASTL